MFKKATKKAAKLRVIIIAPSGAGKTFSALRIASGIGGKIAFIDTERRSAIKYADRFDFDVAEAEMPTIDNLIKFINGAQDYDILILDSITHAWQTLLEEIDILAAKQFRGNTFRAWATGTPKQRKFINAILDFPGHIIATARAKTEYIIEDQNGKKVPVKVGLGAEQGKGIEYEFDMLIEMTPEHVAHITKDRTGKFSDQSIDKPDEKFGAELAKWLSDGVTVEQIRENAIKAAEKAITINELMEVYNNNRDLQNDNVFKTKLSELREKLNPKVTQNAS